MFRVILSSVLIAVAAGFAISSPAIDSIPVDSAQIPVPAGHQDQWVQVIERNHWHTSGGDTIVGRFQKFLVRKFHVFRKNNELLVRIEWFSGNGCQSKVRKVKSLEPARRHLLARLFGPLDQITAPVSQVVVFCSFSGTTNNSTQTHPAGRDGSEEDEATTDESSEGGDDTTSDDEVGIDSGDEGTDDGGEGGGSAAGLRVPFPRLQAIEKNLMAPFAAAARSYFNNKLSSSDCNSSGDDDSEGDSDDQGDDSNIDDGGSGGGSGDAYGFMVETYSSPAGTIRFNLINKHPACIEANSPGDALAKLRERFKPHIRPASRERISYRFKPNPKCCENESDGGSSEDYSDDDYIHPSPDPIGDGGGESIDEQDIPI